MKKDIILFMTIFFVLSMIAGGTYAYWQWVNANETTVVFNTMKDISDYVYYDAGESHFVGNFQQSSTHCGGQSTTAEFYIKSDAPSNLKEKGADGKGILSATINMKINAIDPAISSSSAVKWAVTAGDAASCGTTTLASGDFSGKTSGNMLTLLNGREIFLQSECSSSKLCKYTVWVWVNNATNNLSGKTIDVNVWSQIDMTSAD